MDSPFVIAERRDSLAIIRLNRPEKLNALSREMIVTLNDIFSNLERQSDVRAIVLTGAGDNAFCAGADIGELTGLDKDQARDVSERGQALFNQIEGYSVPVIAAINGIAVGAGCELALACHIRIASPNASFSLPETKLGIIPGSGVTERLAREIRWGRALEIVLTRRTVDAEEALRIGLINRIADDSVLTEAESLAQEISILAPLAIRACIEAVTRGIELPLAEGLALEAQLFSSLFATNDMREGTRAFLEKRLPVFKGS
jgi:enoyl-CoA hydratase/carnithine racemase